MAEGSDESSASHSQSQSETSSNDDSAPINKAISPNSSPRTPSSYTPQDRKFNNSSSPADASQPSGASTSVSSESNGRSPTQRRNSARSSTGHSNNDSEAGSAFSPASSANTSASCDNSSGLPSRSISDSHGSSRHSSNSRSRRSSSPYSDDDVPSQDSSRSHSESTRNHDSDTGCASPDGRSSQGSLTSQSYVRSPTAPNTYEESPVMTGTNEESVWNSTPNDNENSRSTHSSSKSRGDMSTKQQTNQSDPLQTSAEAQSTQHKDTQARHSVTSPKSNPESSTQSNSNEIEFATKKSDTVAPDEAMPSDPIMAPILEPPMTHTQATYAPPNEGMMMNEEKSPSITSDPKEPGDTKKAPQPTLPDARPDNDVDESKSGPSDTAGQNVKATNSRPSILQRLEERRRALQAQSNVTQEHSNVVLASKSRSSKSNESPPKSDGTSREARVQVEKDIKKPLVETLSKPTIDDPSSKLDSQSDYDPRRDDTEKWKDLVRRSTQGSSEQRSSGIFRRGKSESTGEMAKMGGGGGDRNWPGADKPSQPDILTAKQINDTKAIDIQPKQSDHKLINDSSGDQGWMPPALTTYGEKKFSPQPCLEEKVDPPMKDGYEYSMNIPSQRLSSGVGLPPKVFTPPVNEIEVRPPPEDDSSLGSMGFLFPKLTPATPRKMSVPVETVAALPAVSVPPEPKRDPTLVTHKLKPTVGGVDYDFYKTWILPGAQPPKPKQQIASEIDREDPPGTTTIFKPKRMVVEPIPLTRPSPKANARDTTTGSPFVPAQPPKPPSESWAPIRPTDPIVQSKPTDEWEAWREAVEAATKAKLPYSATKRSTRSDLSSTSDWAPPTRPDGWNSKYHGTAAYDEENAGHRWSTWIPPSQASRVDFAGSIISQPTPLTQERKVYKEPLKPNSFEKTKEFSSRSSYNSTSDEGSHTSHEASHSSQLSVSTSKSESHNVSEDSATNTSGSSSGSPDPHIAITGLLDEADNVMPVHDAVPAEIATKPTSPEHDERLETSPVVQTKATTASKRRFSPFWVCLLAIILIIVFGGIITIVTLVLLGKLSEKAPAPAVSPAAPSSPPAPVANPGDLTALIAASSLNTATAFEDPKSAQSLALSWLSENQFLGTYSDEQKIQRFVLAVIFYSTTGESWNNNDLWVSDIDECDWYSAETVNEVCNSEHEIDEIDLKTNELVGEFPWTELVMLSSQLLILDLKENRLSGPIADVVGDMSFLLVFDVQNNEFTGTIPSMLGQLTDARQLNLSQNRLSGSIPLEIASMSSLQALWLNNNLLTGAIPSELGRLSNVRSIYLSGNDFSGTLPEEICALGLENLEVDCEVDCSCCTSACGEGSTSSPVEGVDGGGGNNTDNQGGDGLIEDELEGNPMYELIMSRFPGGGDALANTSSPQRAAFRWLQSSANAAISSDEKLLQRYALASLFYATGGSQWKNTVSWLSGEDECFWYTSSNAGMICDSNGRLSEINLVRNNLQGSLPMEIGLLDGSLEILDLSGNNMTGSIPTTIKGMVLLKQIDLSLNKLFGIVPSELGSMSNLQRIVLSDNNLFSTIPTELGLLTQLEYLDLGSNQLTGTIPDSFGSLQSLAGLGLYKNFLSGTLPVTLSSLSNLQLLYLDENDLSGPIQTSLCQLTLEEFWSDCQETQCNCCTTCCSDGGGCV